jgi:hypothetical protein
MKLGMFSGRADFKPGQPITFEMQLPDACHIVDANVVFGHTSVQLHLVAVHDKDDKIVPMKLIALLTDQEHPDVREHEFVGKAPAKVFTSPIRPYYLFAAPRPETTE